VALHQLQIGTLPGRSGGQIPTPGTDSLQGAALGIMGKVLTTTTLTCEEFLSCLDKLESTLPGSGLKLVLVDSIASLARKEFDVSGGRGIIARTEFLLRVSARLK